MDGTRAGKNMTAPHVRHPGRRVRRRAYRPYPTSAKKQRKISVNLDNFASPAENVINTTADSPMAKLAMIRRYFRILDSSDRLWSRSAEPPSHRPSYNVEPL